jgi:PHD/YefM family antitoxin component YafN of YafNO toxin-antitoxin module
MATEIDHLRKGDVVEMPVEEFERLQATLELLQNEALKNGILASVEEYEEGRSRSWDEVREDL